MGSNGDKREIAPIAQVDYMLTRRVEQLSGLPRGEHLVMMRFRYTGFGNVLSHQNLHRQVIDYTQYTQHID